MRVLPYFKTTLLNQPVSAARRSGKSAQAAEPENVKVAAPQAPPQDEFIPLSPVTGLVYSIKPDSPRADFGSGVFKSGSYSFYRLNGRLEPTQDPQKGVKLDLKG
ncbi:MAG TPA: hypothetical protein VM123_10290 [archaeon]|nr:hypothetical protein [archaeon]